MDELDNIVENIRTDFDARNKARDEALAVCRMLTRHCAHAIRAVHREEADVVNEHLAEANKFGSTASGIFTKLTPTLYFAGYTQDASKRVRRSDYHQGAGA